MVHVGGPSVNHILEYVEYPGTSPEATQGTAFWSCSCGCHASATVGGSTKPVKLSSRVKANHARHASRSS